MMEVLPSSLRLGTRSPDILQGVPSLIAKGVDHCNVMIKYYYANIQNLSSGAGTKIPSVYSH